MPARKLAIRATFIPCSASGIAHPRITSSISATSRPGARSTAALITAAAMSSGRVDRSVPFGALPTGVLTALTITASRMISPLVPERFAGLQRVLDSLERLSLAEERHERLALEVEQVLLRHGRRVREVAAGHDLCDLVRNLRVVLRDEPALLHLVDAELERGERRSAERGNVRPRPVG